MLLEIDKVGPGKWNGQSMEGKVETDLHFGMDKQGG